MPIFLSKLVEQRRVIQSSPGQQEEMQYTCHEVQDLCPLGKGDTPLASLQHVVECGWSTPPST